MNYNVKDYSIIDEQDNLDTTIIRLTYADLQKKSNCVETLKLQYPNTLILFDWKISSRDLLEIKYAYNEGADIVSVLASVHDATLIDAQRIADASNRSLMLDFTGCSDLTKRMEDADILGIEYAYLPIDMCMTGCKIPKDIHICQTNKTKFTYMVERQNYNQTL